ncbi:hypothetical protein B0H13DRAFT_1877953 [Mycena leptocephala]|nr:hypothetical protein B0H13DRAFT_1877953 [Mycena leptocephala]
MGTEIPSFTSHFSATEIIDFVGLKFGRRTSGGLSADCPQTIRRSSADGLPLITNAAFKQGGTLWNGGDINECEGWTFCTRYTGGGDLADTNSTGQPRTRRLETRQNLSYL